VLFFCGLLGGGEDYKGGGGGGGGGVFNLGSMLNSF